MRQKKGGKLKKSASSLRQQVHVDRETDGQSEFRRRRTGAANKAKSIDVEVWIEDYAWTKFEVCQDEQNKWDVKEEHCGRSKLRGTLSRWSTARRKFTAEQD